MIGVAGCLTYWRLVEDHLGFALLSCAFALQNIDLLTRSTRPVQSSLVVTLSKYNLAN